MIGTGVFISLLIHWAVATTVSRYSNADAFYQDQSRNQCGNLPEHSSTRAAIAPVPTEWLVPFAREHEYWNPLPAACNFKLYEQYSKDSSSRCESITSAVAVTPRVTPPPSVLRNQYGLPFSATDTECASSWRNWLYGLGVESYWHSQTSWCLEGRGRTVTTVIPVTTSTITTTLCDGIPRVSYLTHGSVTKTYTITDARQLDIRQDLSHEIEYTFYSQLSSVKSKYADGNPHPTCGLKGRDCDGAWDSIKSMLYNLVPREFNGIELFGCAPPKELCRVGDVCAIGSSGFKLIYFDPGVEDSDLCGNDGHGLYRTNTWNSGPPQVTTIPAITFEKDFAQSPNQNLEQKVIAGPHVFTSGKFYLAYVDVQAMDGCSFIGPSTPASGVVEVPLSQLNTVVRRPPTWDGSDLSLAKVIAAGKHDIPRGASALHMTASGSVSNWSKLVRNIGWEFSTRPLNVADLQGPVPAANYYMQPGLDCDKGRFNCSTITEGDYEYSFAMPATFLEMEPAWKSCNTGGWIRDPPMVLSTTTQPQPSGPAWAHPHVSHEPGPLSAFATVQVAPGQTMTTSLPAATANAPIATVTLHAQATPKAGSPVGTIEVVLEAASPLSNGNADSNGRPAQAAETRRLMLAGNLAGPESFTAGDAQTGEAIRTDFATDGQSHRLIVGASTSEVQLSTPDRASPKGREDPVDPQGGSGEQVIANADNREDSINRFAPSGSTLMSASSTSVRMQSAKAEQMSSSMTSKSGASRRLNKCLFAWCAFGV